MVSGIPTASGYEERIQFSEMEVVDRGANENGILANVPEGHAIHGWDVNVAAVRVRSVRRTVRHHQHAVSHPCEVVWDHADRIGIHHPCSQGRTVRFVCWKAIWRFRKVVQTTAD